MMPSLSDPRAAHGYAERIRERLLRRSQEWNQLRIHRQNRKRLRLPDYRRITGRPTQKRDFLMNSARRSANEGRGRELRAYP